MSPSARPAFESSGNSLLAALNSQSVSVQEGDSLHLPRLLCLHGGGTNARIFEAQCRIIKLHLAQYFRLVFADAPFVSWPGPDVELVYAECGPFRSWLRPVPGLSTGYAVYDADEATIKAIDRRITIAMDEDDKLGGTGEWVGLLGFSQGAKMAASLLLRQQKLNAAGIPKAGEQVDSRKTNYRFAVVMAGRGPLISMDPDAPEEQPGLLTLKTIHVHGLQDPGLEMHRDLLYDCCKTGSTRLVEWDGNHRLPIKTKDVDAVVTAILDVAEETGALTG